jgi:hypothetical protein
MSQQVFIQRSRLGRVTFWRRGEALEITHEGWGTKSKHEIPLRSISPEYEIGSKRIWLLAVFPLVIAIGCLVGYRFLSQMDIPLLPQLSMYLLVFGGIALMVSFRGLPRVEYFSFKDHWNRPLFAIVREREQIESCNAFVADLLDNIDRLAQGLPDTATVADHRSTPGRSSLVFPPEADAQNRWQLALVAGAIATLFPFFATEHVIIALGVPVVVVASTCGVVAGVRSLMKKEPQKRWAFVGIGLSLIPWVFFLDELALTAR